jgi:hypothetical protein
MRMLDLFCGRFGWSKAFAERGWECVGIDLVEPPEIPAGCKWRKEDVLSMDIPLYAAWIKRNFDFVCASSPCEQFSVHGMKCFHKAPPYPEMGIRLFSHTRALCEATGLPYVMENVRAAQDFVGKAANHCGSFYLWGSGVPPILPQGITKGMKLAGMSGAQARAMTREERLIKRRSDNMLWSSSKSAKIARACITRIRGALPAHRTQLFR